MEFKGKHRKGGCATQEVGVVLVSGMENREIWENGCRECSKGRWREYKEDK